MDAKPVTVGIPFGTDPVSQMSDPGESAKPSQVGDGPSVPPSQAIKCYPVQPLREPLPLGGFPPSGCVGYGQQPIVTQPGLGTGFGLGGLAKGDAQCPRGLEYLASIDQLLVKQKVVIFEALTGFETNNRYSIQNTLGQKVFYAVEDTNCCTRNCCPERPFHIKIFDSYLKNEVIHLHRPLGCSSICCPCCLHSIEVTAPPGNVIGRIQEEWAICRPCFRILNPSGDLALRIEGPACFCSMCCSVNFNVISLAGEKVGRISKQWSGLGREWFTDADMFGLTFPMDLDVNLKAVLLGATFLIDFMFFEKSCECCFKFADCCVNCLNNT
ncbi:phospholipid scramblase 2 [Drosophila biarmipes]|uniref:phospholipid scramblase 2 n=1 Tax=Drosophila biarmipes TaxID=125945 RepID=UPI001CDB2D91|nr:phospholipid scramblase 2 [Drosophila biarmipes]XP_043951259.1 phospholipid scramblase 2 [Drosophila biarmipes]XP_043951260.1 phospholipid scramblase 2 [Drosophila biarmipes]